MTNNKIIVGAAKIAACRELFIKYQGKSHKKIELEMRELGFTDFSRRILYKRSSGRGQRLGWIAEYGLAAAGSPPYEGGVATASADGVVLCAANGASTGSVPPALAGGTNVLGSNDGSQNSALPVWEHRDLTTGSTQSGAVPPAYAGGSDPFADFQTWLKRVSPNMTWDWRHQLYLYERLQRVTDGICKRLMIFMPPRHGKSELVTVRYTAWRMRRKPEMNVILASYGQQLANTFSRGIKRVLCDDFALSEQPASESQPGTTVTGAFAPESVPSGSVPPAVAGGALALDSGQSEAEPRELTLCDACRTNTTEPAKRSTAKHRASETRACRFEGTDHRDGACAHCNAGLRVVNAPPATAGGTDSSRMFPFTSQRPVNTAAQWGTAVGGGLRAVGVGGGVTGFGADLIVIDDPVKSRAQAESETYRDRVWEWYNDDLYTRLEPEGSIILIQTRWHEDDLAGRLLKQMNEGGEQWEVVDLPALAEVGETGSGGEEEKMNECEIGARASCPPVSEPGAVATGFPVVITHAEDKDSSPPSGLSGNELNESSGVAAMPAVKAKVIGFPRLYSHLDADAGNADALVGNAGSSGVKATEAHNGQERETGGIRRTACGVVASENASKLTLPAHHHTGGTGVAGEGACAPVIPNSPPYEGGVAAASVDGVVLRAAELAGIVSTDTINPNPENHPVSSAKPELPPLLRKEGSYVGGQHARAPVVSPLLLHSSSPPLPQDPIGRSPGDALCPERYDKPKLNEIRSQLGTYGFSALYQQHPTPADGAIFKKAWLRNIVESAPPGLRWFRGYDLAISTRTTADYTASFRVAVDDLGYLYIADGFRERIEYPEQRRFILERIRSERDTRHGIEDSAHGKAIVQDLRRDLRLFNFSFQGVPVVGDKLTRALKWSPLAEAGKLRLVRGAWIKAFVNELIRFPKGKHDDQTDAVSIAVHMMAEMPDRKLYKF